MHGAEMNEDEDAEGETYAEREGGSVRRPHPPGLADLDSPRGRWADFLLLLFHISHIYFVLGLISFTPRLHIFSVPLMIPLTSSMCLHSWRISTRRCRKTSMRTLTWAS
jgi:hypothetical protein